MFRNRNGIIGVVYCQGSKSVRHRNDTGAFSLIKVLDFHVSCCSQLSCQVGILQRRGKVSSHNFCKCISHASFELPFFKVDLMRLTVRNSLDLSVLFVRFVGVSTGVARKPTPFLASSFGRLSTTVFANPIFLLGVSKSTPESASEME